MAAWANGCCSLKDKNGCYVPYRDFFQQKLVNIKSVENSVENVENLLANGGGTCNMP